MELKTLMKEAKDFVFKLYEENTDPEYDMFPFCLGSIGDAVDMIALAGDQNPMDMAKSVVAFKKFEGFVFVSPGWKKSPEDPSVRVGELIMIVGETVLERQMISLDVVRDPLPVVTEPEALKDPELIEMRVGHFLYNIQPTRH